MVTGAFIYLYWRGTKAVTQAYIINKPLFLIPSIW